MKWLYNIFKPYLRRFLNIRTFFEYWPQKKAHSEEKILVTHLSYAYFFLNQCNTCEMWARQRIIPFLVCVKFDNPIFSEMMQRRNFSWCKYPWIKTELSHRENSTESVQGRATRFRRLKRVPGEIDAMHANASSRALGHTFLRIASGNARFIILPNNCLEQFIIFYYIKFPRLHT